MNKAEEDAANVELGDEAGEPTVETSSLLLEEKYNKQMRQIHPQKIELPISALTQMMKEQIKLNPEFQRRDRWDVKKQSRFIESIIMNVPVPPVFLGEEDLGSYVVLDGRQRLTAVYEFLRNTYRLDGLKVWSELNNSRYVELEEKGLEKTLTRRFIPAILLLKESSPEVKYDVFDRLNTGGVKANEMEIRNAIFQGEFNRLLHSLSEDPTFRFLWDIPSDAKALKENTLYSQMTDVELVLRFFAVADPEQINGRLKDYLGFFMKDRNAAVLANSALGAEYKAQFLRAVACSNMVFGESAFARKSPDGKCRKSAPLADAVMSAFSMVDPAKLTAPDPEKLKDAFNKLVEEDVEFKKSISSGTNGKGAISVRVQKAKALVEAIVPHAMIV